MATIHILTSMSHQDRQAAINAAVPGDHVIFEEGDHELLAHEYLVFHGDPEDTLEIYYTGNGTLKKVCAPGEQTEPCVKLRGGASGSGGTKAHRVVVDGLRFSGGGLFARELGGEHKHIQIKNCLFLQIRTGIGANGQGRCLDFTAGLNVAEISNNRFENCLIQRGTSFGEAYAIYGLRFKDVSILNNTAENVQQFLFLNQAGVEGLSPYSGQIIVRGNTVNGLTRAGIEIHGNDGIATEFGQDSEIESNVIKNWLTQTSDSANWLAAYGIRIEARYAKSWDINDNTVEGPGVAGFDGRGVRAAIRVRGVNQDVFSNTLKDCSFGILFAEGSGAYYWNNMICGSLVSHAAVQGVHAGIVDGTIRGGSASPNIFRTLCSTALTPYDVPVPNGEFDYVSDLVQEWTDLQNGLGPIEVDMSNGTDAVGDGRTIQIDLGRYSKGIGMHAYGRLRLALPPGRYAKFMALVGVDDEILPGGENKGAVTFVVSADGTVLYSSPVMKQGDPAEAIEVSVVGKQELTLEVYGDAASAQYNRASWGFARLVRTEDDSEPIARVVKSWTHDVALKSFTLRFEDGSSDTSDLQ